jgi:hypothetical protein
MMVMLGSLVLGLALLAGGYGWVLTGSLVVGLATGAHVGVAVAWLFRTLGRRRGRPLVGEVRLFDAKEELTCYDDGRDGSASRLQRESAGNPQLVAGSIRRMMQQGKAPRNSRRR